jgi:hypothetical protein
MRTCGWLFYEPRELDECQLADECIIAARNIHFWMATEPACRLGLRRATSRRCQSVVTSKTLPDPIKPSVKRVKSGMKAFFVKMKTSGDALSTPEPAQSYWK